MLLIDDEADNASVNTKGENNPTAINAAVRRILALFEKGNYVGFTATPYANIFINPDTEDEMLEHDLFPEDFIYVLDPPSNYIGARDIFGEDAKYAYLLKNNDDCEMFIPERHKKDFIPYKLPQSLKIAIASFFIINVIRDLRGDNKAHRTMMVNISRFIMVQNHITEMIDNYVREMIREIKNYYLIGERALQYDSFRFIKDVYDKHFAVIDGFEYSWDDIQKNLRFSVASIDVRTINGGNSAKQLNYDEYEDDGLRLIAVGGISLSRGLTLEGLCVSYFYRNSKMYDTLMQMGRWFGYRKGYEDVCQIWMPDTAVSWYSYISEASDELRKEVGRMRNDGRTPKDFGLCVRSDITSLLVTARNKMKTSKDYIVNVSLNGKVIETPYLHSEERHLKSNIKATKVFFDEIAKAGYTSADTKDLAVKNIQYLNVSKEHIVNFLKSYKAHHLNMEFRPDDIIALINKNEDEVLDTWDILIASGRGGKEICVNGQKIQCIARACKNKPDTKALQMSGKNSRLGDKGFAKGGLTKEIAEKIEELNGGKNLSQNVYFNAGVRRNPLLIIYPVAIKKDDKIIFQEDVQIEKINSALEDPIIGLGIGIPRIDGKISQTYTYKINMIKWKELLEIDDMSDFEEIDDTVE